MTNKYCTFMRTCSANSWRMSMTPSDSIHSWNVGIKFIGRNHAVSLFHFITRDSRYQAQQKKEWWISTHTVKLLSFPYELCITYKATCAVLSRYQWQSSMNNHIMWLYLKNWNCEHYIPSPICFTFKSYSALYYIPGTHTSQNISSQHNSSSITDTV